MGRCFSIPAFLSAAAAVLFWLAIPTSNLCAQLSLSAGYSYLQAPEWDEIFQTYNFARPWQKETWSPPDHGFRVETGYSFLFLDYGQFYLEPSVGFSRWSSSADVGDHTISSSIHLYSGTLHLRFSPRALFREYFSGPLGPRFFAELSPAYNAWIPSVRENGVWYEPEEGEMYRPISWSFSGTAALGYHALTVGRWVLTPRLACTWFPSVELEDYAQAIQGSPITGLSNEADNLLIFEGSLMLHLLPKDTGWWNSPRKM